jgi:hypothetical protein
LRAEGEPDVVSRKHERRDGPAGRVVAVGGAQQAVEGLGHGVRHVVGRRAAPGGEGGDPPDVAPVEHLQRSEVVDGPAHELGIGGLGEGVVVAHRPDYVPPTPGITACPVR